MNEVPQSDPCVAREAAISVAGLKKRYGSTEALRDVSFQVQAGRIFGLLGPNGAGKTTAIECILGLRDPDEGTIGVNGIDVRAQPRKAKLQLGAQLQAATLQDKITPRQALDLFGSFYAEPFATVELISRFGLEDHVDAPFETLSGGLRQRLFLALALVNRPAVVVFDEPTAGLDPQARRALRSLIRDMKEERRTVLLSTHDIEEAAQLCDEVAVIDQGRIVAVGTPEELIAHGQALARVSVRTVPPLSRELIHSISGVKRAVYDGAWILETTSPNRLLAELVRRADETGAEVVDFALRRPSLEDVFLELTGRAWETDPATMP